MTRLSGQPGGRPDQSGGGAPQPHRPDQVQVRKYIRDMKLFPLFKITKFLKSQNFHFGSTILNIPESNFPHINA